MATKGLRKKSEQKEVDDWDDWNAESEEEEDEEERPAAPRTRRQQTRVANGRKSAPTGNKQRKSTRTNKSGHRALSWNDVTFSGNLGRDPMLQVTGNGIPYTTFSLAVYTGKDRESGESNPPMWMNVKCWRDLAEEAEEKLSKGEHVLVKGQLTHWKDRDGNVHFQVIADYLEIGWPE